MQLFKLPVVVLVFIAIRCRGEILIAAPSLDESLVEDLVKIVTSCYGDEVGHGVGLAGNVPDTLSRTLMARHLTPIVLIDGITKLHDSSSIEANINPWQQRFATLIRYRHKLSVFIVEPSSLEQLWRTVFPNIENTIWQNNMASYFILDRSFGCANSQDFLVEAWKYKFLNAKVMCCHYKSEKIIVTFNPFTDKGPLPWQRHFKEYNSIFVKFSRNYGEHEAICENLNFDKTKDLGGSEIVVEGKPLGAGAREAVRLHEYQYYSETDRVMTTIFRALNVTPVFTSRDRGDMYVKNVDIKPHIRILFDETVYRLMTYPREQLGEVLVSHRARELRLNTIRPGIDIDSAFGLGIVYSIIPFFFKLFVQQPLASAFLNLIRITCNMNFSNLAHNNAPRIYLTSLLLYAVTVQEVYQGHLACMLTTRIPRRSVETIADLGEFGYKTVFNQYREVLTIEDPELRKKVVAVSNAFQCVKYAKRNSSAGCLWLRVPQLLDLAQEFDMHVSSKSVRSSYITFEIHNKLPYEQRLNVIIGRMAEADLLRYRDVRSPTRFADFPSNNSESNTYGKNNNFEKMNLRELRFAFVILSIGLACATITFIAELAIKYKCRIVRRHITNAHV